MTDNELVQFKTNFEQIFSIKKLKFITKKKDYYNNDNPVDSPVIEYFLEIESFVDPLNRRAVSEVVAVYGELFYDLKIVRWFDRGETFVAQTFDYNPEILVVDIPIDQLDPDNWISEYTNILNDNLNNLSFPIKMTTKKGYQFEHEFIIEEKLVVR